MTAPISPSLLRAYRQTRYRAGDLEIRIGRRSAAADRLLASHGAAAAVLISGWNPLSRRMPAGWNRRMHRALAAAVRRCSVMDAEGTWRGWSESHLLVFAPVRPMLRLARRFRQRAVVVLARARPPRLLVSRQ